MRGRKKTPTKIKKLRGTLRKDRQLKDEFEAQTLREIPPPPTWLPDLAVEEWDRICTEMIKNGMLASLDLSLLAIYCNEYSVYISMELEMRNTTRVIAYKDEKGKIKHVQSIAHQVIANRALEKMLSLSREFGFTPASRTKIGTESTGGAKVSPIDRLGDLARAR